MLKKINLENSSFGVVKNIEFKRLDANSIVEGISNSEIEIVTYVIAGKLTYKDSIGNLFNLGRGEVMYSSCGENLEYSIANHEQKELVILQYTITPATTDLTPSSEAHKYKWKLRINQWLEIVSKLYGEAEIRVNQDVKVEVLMLDAKLTEGLAVDSDRMAYLIQLEGNGVVNNIELESGDGLVIEGEDIFLTTTTNSHYIVIEVAKND